MNTIVAADMHRGIGKNGNLLVHIKNDMKRFKELTEHKVVIMGRKTLESLPNGKPLKNRTNIVMSRDYNYHQNGCVVVHNLDTIKNEIFMNFNSKDIFVIGGGEIYKLLLPLCDTVYMTYLDKIYGADAFFPELSHDEWSLENEDISDIFYDDVNDVRYNFMTYHRR